MQKPATRDDVAKLARVSTSVVSYVINGTRGVSTEKQQRVLKAIEELHYTPNLTAKSLKCHKTYHIAYICDDVTNVHFAEVLQEMESLAYKKGYIISLCHARAENEYLEALLSRQFDGIVISSMRLSTKQINRLAQIPMVILLNREDEGLSPSISRLIVNIYGGAKAAMNYLLNLGCRKISFVEGISTNREQGTDYRKMAYLDVLAEHKMQPHLPNAFVCGSYQELYQRVYSAACMDYVPDAIFCHDDMHAMVVAKACEKAGKRVPSDVAVVGFDSIHMLEYFSPDLSTVEIPNHIMGSMAMDMLFDMIERQKVSTMYVDTRLVARW